MSHPSNHDSTLQLHMSPPIQGGAKRVSPGASSSSPLPCYDLLSNEPLPTPHTEPPTPPDNPTTGVPTRPKNSVWLDGASLMCGCPDCNAPISVRLWLMVADCWRCATSVELTEEQQREADRLLKQRRPTHDSAAVSQQTLKEPPRRHRPPPKLSPAKASAQRAPIYQISQVGTVNAWLNELIEMTPAWLVSLVFHFVMLTLLALFTISEDLQEPEILLSTTIARQRSEGGEVVLDPRDMVKFDLPLPKNIDLKNDKQFEAALRADQDARELRIDPNSPDPQLPDLPTVKHRVENANARQSFAARDPRVRVEMIRQEGGTTFTEAAVARGLRWLAQHQNRDGSWSLHAFHTAARCNCGGKGAVRSDTAGASLALLPFLGAGQSHLTGRYQDQVSKGLRWLIEHQKPDGDLRSGSSGNTGMYAQGQATIVLCEAYAMEGDESLHKPAQLAIDFIVAAQHIGGGWRYKPGDPGDTSVLGWQLMALQSARAAGLHVPQETLLLAEQYLDSVAHHDGSQYSYLPKNNPTHVMTAEALLCRMYLGWTFDSPALGRGIEFLTTNHLPSRKQPNIYYWYYATQATHHVGGEQWERWNLKIRDILVDMQETRGHQAGSWTPITNHDRAGGRLYMTALATCTLEVYYRHLPIFRQIKLD